MEAALFLAALVAMALGAGALSAVTAVPLLLRFARTSAADACALALPMAMTFAVAAALLLPALDGNCHCLAHDPHHPHLCPWHPSLAAPLQLPAAWLLLSWALFVAGDVVKVLHQALATTRWQAGLRDAPLDRSFGVPVFLRSCGAHGAVTVGFLRPVIVCDPLVWQALGSEGRRALVSHEQAHARRHDAAVLFLLRLSVALFPFDALLRALASWRRSVEQVCDRHATASVGDPLVVARTLVEVHRVRSTDSVAIPAALGMTAPSELESRVTALLALVDKEGAVVRLRSDGAMVALLSCIVLVVALCLPGGGLHHAIESVLGLLFAHR